MTLHLHTNIQRPVEAESDMVPPASAILPDAMVDPISTLGREEISYISFELVLLYHALLRSAVRASAEQPGSALERDMRYPRKLETALFSLLNDGFHNLVCLAAGVTAYSQPQADRLDLPFLQRQLKDELSWLHDQCRTLQYPAWWETHRSRPVRHWRKLCDRIAFRLRQKPVYGQPWRPAGRRRIAAAIEALVGRLG